MDGFPYNPIDLIEAMKETSTLHMFEELVIYHSRKKLQNEIIPAFLNQVDGPTFSEVLNAVENLHASMLWFFKYISGWHNAKNLKLRMNAVLNACLKWELRSSLNESFNRVFAYCFQFHLHDPDDVNMADDDPNRIHFQWMTEKYTMAISEMNVLVEKKFKPMVQIWLVDLGMVDAYCLEPLHSILEVEIDRYITRACKGKYEKSWIGEEDGNLEVWARTRVIPWLRLVLGDAYNARTWQEKLTYLLYNSYTKLRISEMLNIITDYPDSSPVLHDLKFCLQHTRLRPCLIKCLKNDIKSRVLHPGVSTQNIITFYIAAVKTLRELDLSGVVMEMVLEPCTTYLTDREDSVRMIMQGLLWDDGSNDLAVELAKSQEPRVATCWSERVTDNPEDWMPDPREANQEKSNKSCRTSDIVTLFIGMYGSKEKFIKEYQKLLSKRLLQTWYNEQSESSEIRNLELLKKRFGEEDMSKCAVMLKDIADSRRINTNVKDDFFPKESIQLDMNLRAMIVSSQFWPEIPNQEFELPPAVASAFERFNKGYESLKASRSLTWLNSVGVVEMELEFKDRTIEFKVNPLQASIIHLFQEKDSWTLNELSDKLKIPPTVLKRKILFWIHQGIIHEIGENCYETMEKSGAISHASSSSTRIASNDVAIVMCDDEEDEEEKENSDEKREKTEQVLWIYVQGMLKNLESLPLDRIHKMLQMFVMHDADVQIELSQLRQLLNTKVQKGHLTIEMGKYKLVRDPS